MDRFVKITITLWTISLIIIGVTLFCLEPSFHRYTHYLYAIAGGHFGTGLVILIDGLNKKS